MSDQPTSTVPAIVRPVTADGPVRRTAPTLGETALLLLAFGTVLLRFLRLDLAPFLYDEPTLLLASWEQVQTGRWVSHSPLVAASSFAYGPVPTWFYGITQSVFGRSAVVNITAMAALVTVSQLAGVFGITAAIVDGWAKVLSTTRGRVVLAIGVLFLGSMSYQYLWSRLAWDLFANLCAFLAVALLSARHLRPWTVGGLGAIVGLGVSSHPMFIPMGVMVAATALWAGPRQVQWVVRRAALLGIGFLIVSLAWIRYLLSLPSGALQSGQQAEVPLSTWFANLVQPATSDGLAYFLDSDWPGFAAGLPKALTSSFTLVWVGVLVVLGLATHLQDERLVVRRLAVLGVAAAVGYPVFYWAIDLGQQPHYMFSASWVPVLGVMLAADLSLRARWARVWPLALITIAISANMTVLLSLRGYIQEFNGTQGIHYGTPVGLQVDAVRQLCGASGSPIVVVNQTAVFQAALAQHTSHVGACQGRQVEICQSGECSNPPVGAAVVILRYRDSKGGRLETVFESR